jgi:protein-L-isoaspartate(D-aspartate) O-methyltransferase
MSADLVPAKAHMRQLLEARGIIDVRVLDAMLRVPREEFVPQSLRDRAYEDNALPIAEGQTISQPLMVALMTQALQLTGDEIVLEIGTGTGYQTAVLAELARDVVSIERIPSLADSAQQRLTRLGYFNVAVHNADGSLGWPPQAPYDAVIVTAGAPDVPAPLYNQLQMGGRLVVPVGDEALQELEVVTKTPEGPRILAAGGCRFVRLIGDAAWPDERHND